MAEGFTQVNINLTKEDTQMLDRMMGLKGYENRSAFMRWLIRQVYAKWFCGPNPVISIEDAQKLALEVEVTE